LSSAPWISSRGSQGDLPILAYIVAGLYAIVRIRFAIRTYGLTVLPSTTNRSVSKKRWVPKLLSAVWKKLKTGL